MALLNIKVKLNHINITRIENRISFRISFPSECKPFYSKRVLNSKMFYVTFPCLGLRCWHGIKRPNKNTPLDICCSFDRAATLISLSWHLCFYEEPLTSCNNIILCKRLDFTLENDHWKVPCWIKNDSTMASLQKPTFIFKGVA